MDIEGTAARTMRLLLLALLLPLAAWAETIVLFGQSNAGSPGQMADMPSALAAPFERTRIFSTHHPYWMIMRPGNNTQSLSLHGGLRNTFGLEVGIATQLASLHPSNNFDIIKVSFGGTCIDQWNSGLLERAIGVIDAAESQPDAFVWVQGECDRSAPSGYASKEEELVDTLRSHYGGAPFFSVLLNRSLDGAIPINDQKALVAVPNVSQISTQWSGFRFKDGVHYDSQTTFYLGRRIANKLTQAGVVK